MKSGAVVVCEGAAASKTARRDLGRLPLALTGRGANLWLKVENVSQSILKNLKPRTIDLLRIALYVYGADTSTKRGTPKDVWADGWSRDFHLVVPVQEPALWASQPVSEALTDAIEFATGDRFTFEFCQGSPQLGQLVFENLGEGGAPVGDLVTLFSGGIDSLGAVIDQVAREQRRPVLVSHRSVATMDARQRQLVSLLKGRFGAAREQLKREVPLLPFGAVTTKPDFSDLSDRRDYLFLELKHVTSKPSLRRVTSEMSSRVTVYRDQGASLLFLVYDPKRYILDDADFIQAFEKHDRVWVTVSR